MFNIVKRIKKRKIEKLEKEKRLEELSKTLDRIVNINIFEPRKIETKNEKIDIYTKLKIDSMSIEQLKNTYSCVEKSLEEAIKIKNYEDITKLKELENKIKKLINEKKEKKQTMPQQNHIDLKIIKNDLLSGNEENLELYYNYLTELYGKYKNDKTEEAENIRIAALTLLKLISLKLRKNKQYTK